MDYVLDVNFKGESISGKLIKEDDEFLTLKLDSGYNAILKKSQVTVLSKKEVKSQAKKTVKSLQKNKSLPKVTILHTGGTIASKIDYTTGAVSSKFEPKELLNLFPELNSIANINSKMIRNMASDDMRFEHFNIMLDEIKKAVNANSDGIIISHGTDTMHYTSAALSYALENLNIPVLLVGAQRSSDRPSSDAYSNLNAAVSFIVENFKLKKKFSRVGICMHSNISDNEFFILDGINAKKMHSSKRNAFVQVNYLPAAKLLNSKIEIIRDELFVDNHTENLQNNVKIQKYNPKLKIAFLKVHPSMFPSEVDFYKNCDAVIIEGTGLGHIPISQIDEFTNLHLDILESIKSLIENGVKVIIGVQTTFGVSNLNVYSPGRKLKSLGVYGHGMNLTTETLFMRTAYILSKDKSNFDLLFNKNLENFEYRDIDIDTI